MKIVPPPKITKATLFKLAVQQAKKGTKLTMIDHKGRYTHWDKIRHLEIPENFTTIERYWHFLKFHRNTQYNDIVFNEQTFCYILTNSIQQNLHQIDSQMHGSVEVKNIHNRDRYIKRSLIEEAISSSQLEGASTTRKVAKEMLENDKAPQDHSERMIYNNYLAIQFIQQNKTDNLTPATILTLHDIITQKTLDDPQDSGRVRTDNNVVVSDNRSVNVLHNPPHHKVLNKALKNICDFANGKTPDYFIHPVIRAIMVHFLIGFYHPFADGNGRSARVLFYWVMLKNNYWLSEYITLSTYIKKAYAQYGESYLMTETDDNDLTYFLLSQLKFIQKAINGLFNYIDKKQQQMQETLNLLKTYLLDHHLNSRQVTLIQHAIKHPGTTYTIQMHRISHFIGYATAHKDLMALAKLSLLQQSKQGRVIVFIAPADLEQRIKSYQG